MLIHLSEVLASEGKKCSYTVPAGFDSFSYHGNDCPITEKTDMALILENKGNQKIAVLLTGSLKMMLPCDRCLEDTEVLIELAVDTNIDMKESLHDEEDMSEEEWEAEQDRLDNQTFVEGYKLDTDKLISQELQLRIPEKVLCKEDCKGFCYQCGKNLNHGACNCKEQPKDLQMSAILDLFAAVTKDN